MYFSIHVIKQLGKSLLKHQGLGPLTLEINNLDESGFLV